MHVVQLYGNIVGSQLYFGIEVENRMADIIVAWQAQIAKLMIYFTEERVKSLIQSIGLG